MKLNPDIIESSVVKMRAVTAISIFSAENTKLQGNSPLQDAIIRDVYFDQYRHIYPGKRYVN